MADGEPALRDDLNSVSEPTEEAILRATEIVRPFSEEFADGLVMCDLCFKETKDLIRAIAAALPQSAPD